MEENKENLGKEAKKVNDAYLKNIGLLKQMNVLNDKGLAVGSKLPKDELGDVVAEFMKEKKEETIARVKTGLKGALQTKLDADKAIAEEKKKFEQFELNKKKEFNAKCAELFKELEGLQEMEKSYYASLGGALDSVSEAPESEEETK